MTAPHLKPMKSSLASVVLVCAAFSAFAQSDFRCTVTTVISAPELPPAQQQFLDQSYVGKDFTVERRTGQMAGVLKILSPVSPQIIDAGSPENGFKMVATMRREQGAGGGTAVYSLVINTFDEAPRKPFLFTYNATAYVGTCVTF
jgi:hypothetical protein